MVWSLETSNGYESDKIAAFVVPYLQGRALDIGCGPRKVWPQLIGMDSCKDYGGKQIESVDILGAGDDLSLFADESLDAIFSSHLLEHFYEADVPRILNEWARVLKPGGRLVLYVPSANFYPRCKPKFEPGCNPDHKWDIYPGDIEKKLRMAMELTKAESGSTKNLGWTQIESEERSNTNEYSLYEVYQKREDGQFVKQVWERNPAGQKRCLVIRYGAIGDAIMTSSILPALKKQGYHITFQCAPKTEEILRHDPNIDEWQVQAEDFVPNQALGPYWETISVSGRYDKIVNLCESIEGALLTMPGRLSFFYGDDVRRKLFGTVNYLERHHDIAGVPHEINPRYFATESELAAARALIKSKAGDAPVVVWAINGSSPHKVYPEVNTVVSWLMQRTPAHVFLMADPGIGKTLQDAIIKTLREDKAEVSRVHGMAGLLQIREALALAQCANLVVGPETGTLNAVGMEDVPKVIYLSHSSEENLTKHWKNATVLLPDVSQSPCYPCHRMHYNWDHCPQNQNTAAALCASSIPPEKVFKAIAEQIIAQVNEAA